jgi:CBS domain containing-hemolysin-like protein
LGKTKTAVTARHVMMVAAATFLLAVAFAFVSEVLSRRMQSLTLSLIFLFFVIIIHIVFDIIGIATTAASETPFHAQSAKRVPGAREGYLLIRHADQVANFANDVIGDITATVSGALGAAIALQLVLWHPALPGLALNVAITSAIAAASVAGKAVGKRYAMDNASRVVLRVGRLLYRLERLTGVRLWAAERGRRTR